MDDKDFDKLFKDAFEQEEGDFHPSDWDRMENLLDEDERDSKELLLIKGVEALLVLLALLTLFRFLPDYHPDSDPFQNQADHPIAVEDAPAPPSTATVPTAPVSKEPATLAADGDEENPLSKQGGVPIIVALLERGSAHPTVYNQPNNQAFTEKGGIPDELADIAALEPFKPGDVGDPKRKKDQSVGGIQALVFRKSGQIAINRNQVMTPYSNETGFSDQRSHFGFGVEGGVSASLGKWEIATGIGYSRTQYRPTTNILRVTGDSEAGYQIATLDKLSFDIVSVPLDIRYYFNKGVNWRFYSSIGATCHLVASSRYSHKQYSPNENTSTPGRLELGHLLSVDAEKGGIVRGGAFRDNYFLTANLGVGVERRINDDLGIFAQPNFSYYLMPSRNGLGPNKDRFNSMSLELGIRKRI